MNLPKMLNPHVTCWTSGTQLSSRLAPACRIEAEMVDAAQVQHLLGIQPPAGPHPSREHGNGLASIPRWGAILKPFCSKLSKPCRGHTKGKKPLVDHGKKPIKTWYLLTLGMIHGMLITGMMIWDNLGSWYRDDSGLGWSLFGPEISRPGVLRRLPKIFNHEIMRLPGMGFKIHPQSWHVTKSVL